MIRKTLVFLSIAACFAFAQNAGKITGVVIDEESGKALIGANVIIEGTSLGQATDASGNYTVIDVPVGTHVVRCEYIGYRTLRISNIGVSGGLTSDLTFKLTKKI